MKHSPAAICGFAVDRPAAEQLLKDQPVVRTASTTSLFQVSASMACVHRPIKRPTLRTLIVYTSTKLYKAVQYLLCPVRT